MKIRHCALCATAAFAAAAISSTASAGFPYGTGQPIVVPSDLVTVSLFLDYTAADYTGNLYFLGSGTADVVTNPAANTDATNQGFFVYANHGTPLGTIVALPGVYNAGDVLHFAYDIIAPGDATTAVLRTDVAGDQDQFAWDPENSFFAIEDIYPQNGSDLDYNDMVVAVIFTPIPAPGALALLGMAALVGARRRRRA